MNQTMPNPDQIPAEVWKKMNITKEAFLELGKRRAEREAGAPAVGSEAPDFSLELLSADGSRTGTTACLSDHRGRSVALVFGSYT